MKTLIDKEGWGFFIYNIQCMLLYDVMLQFILSYVLFTFVSYRRYIALCSKITIILVWVHYDLRYIKIYRY